MGQLPLPRVWKLMKGIGKLREPKPQQPQETALNDAEMRELSGPTLGPDHSPPGIQAWMEQQRKAL